MFISRLFKSLLSTLSSSLSHNYTWTYLTRSISSWVCLNSFKENCTDYIKNEDCIENSYTH